MNAGISSNFSGFTSFQHAPEGSQVAFLQNGASVFSQQISGFNDGDYVITFDAAQRASGGGTEPSIQDFPVTLDGVSLGTFQPTSTDYVEFTATALHLSSGSHLLAFNGLDSSSSYDVTAFVDDVRIQQVASVPEPGSLSLIGIGAFAGLALTVHRRHLKDSKVI